MKMLADLLNESSSGYGEAEKVEGENDWRQTGEASIQRSDRRETQMNTTKVFES